MLVGSSNGTLAGVAAVAIVVAVAAAVADMCSCVLVCICMRATGIPQKNTS